MATILQQILDRLDVVAKATAPSATSVYRDRADAFSREEAPAINVLAGTPTIEAFAEGWDRHDTLVMLDIHVRAEPGTPAADAVHAPVHAAITTDSTLAQLAASVRLVDQEYTPAEADVSAFKKRATYRFTYLSLRTAI